MTRIISEAAKQAREPASFVAGTLVHTREGLRHIEQVLVGDYVLSTPENGRGEASYKQVLQTHALDGSVVYFVSYAMNATDDAKQRELGHLVVRGSHPFWVERLEDRGEITEYSAWVGADRLLELYAETGRLPMFELQDGRLVQLDFSGPILRMARAELGIVHVDPMGSFADDPHGVAVDFANGRPEVQLDERGQLRELPIDLEPDDDEYRERPILYRTSGYEPLLRRVYGLEVAENHTYFVGAGGVLVRDTSDEAVSKLQSPKA